MEKKGGLRVANLESNTQFRFSRICKPCLANQALACMIKVKHITRKSSLAVWAPAICIKMQRTRSTHAALAGTMELVWEFGPPIAEHEEEVSVREQDWKRMRPNIAMQVESAFTAGGTSGGTRVGDYLYDFCLMRQVNLVVGTTRPIRRQVILH